MEQPTSLFERYFTRKRPWWVTLIISLTLLLLPFVAVFIDGGVDDFFNIQNWRIYYLAPTIIIYIWLVSPLMARTGGQVIYAIKNLVDLNGAEYDRIVQDASKINPTQEWLSFGIGILFSIIAIQSTDYNQGLSWITIYWIMSTCLMYGVLAWTIFMAISSTRVNTVLHHLPMHIDILDPKQFETVGRQSLLLALLFIGGITLSLLFTFQEGSLSSPEFWIFNILFVLFTVLIFFLSMRPTHRLLAKEKENELEPIQSRINNKCRELALHLDQNDVTSFLSAEINALAVYEERLLAARTWPYNVTMLRTLFFSVFIPLGSILARLVVDIFIP